MKDLNKYLVLGVMTGTSMDGIDLSLIKTDGINYVKIIKEENYSYSLKKQIKLKKIVENKPNNISKIYEYFQLYEQHRSIPEPCLFSFWMPQPWSRPYFKICRY